MMRTIAQVAFPDYFAGRVYGHRSCITPGIEMIGEVRSIRKENLDIL
jgi:hypothetical protein